jgi:FHA domain-containing protein
MPGRLVVRPAQGARREVALDADVVTIGRSPDCDIVLDFSYISRVHARVEVRDGRYVLIDSGSTNGTFVNGKRMDAPHSLTAGDHIAVADVSITFLDVPASADARTLAMPNDSPVRCDPATREVWINDEKVPARLSAQEFQLLLLLSTEYGRVCPRDELAMAIWGAGNYDYNMLHRLVHRLKQKLAAAQALIHVVPGVGYVLGLPAES